MSAGEMFRALRQALSAQDAGFEAAGELVSQHVSLSNALCFDDREQALREQAYAALDRGDQYGARALLVRADELDRLQRQETERGIGHNLSARQFIRACNGLVDGVRDILGRLVGIVHDSIEPRAGTGS